MSHTKVFILATALALFGTTSAHGTVTGIVSSGKYFPGYSPSFQFARPEPKVAGWRIPDDLDNGFVPPSSFSNADIICHKGASNPLGEAIPVTAGSTIDLQWTDWPESHHGPVIDYLAPCTGGDCSGQDKTALEFFKIGEAGLKIGSGAPGQWASDDLIKNNNTWAVKIPDNIAAGEYVLRHEIIALHSSGERDGAQNYPQCINIVVSGSGTEKPRGVVGTKLYTAEDPGILVNIYQNLAEYIIPGPQLFSSGGSAPQPSAIPSAISTRGNEVVPSSTSVAEEEEPVATQAPTPDQNELPGSGPIVSEDETTTLQLTITSSVAAGPEPTPAPQAPTCEGSTTTIIEKGPTITAAAATVTITQGVQPAATVTVKETVTVTARPSFKPMPSGATIDDLMRWVGDKIKPGRSKRHSRDIMA